MDASAASPDLSAWALKIVIGVIVAILGAILYDMNERIKYIERNAITPDNLKENLREVITETDWRHHK